MASTSSREGTALPQSTAASFPEQEEGAEKLPASQAGGFPAVPTLYPPPFRLCTPPDQRGNHLLSPFGPETPNESKVPHPTGEVGEGEAAEPLP